MAAKTPNTIRAIKMDWKFMKEAPLAELTGSSLDAIAAFIILILTNKQVDHRSQCNERNDHGTHGG